MMEKKILRLLQDDCRLSMADIAERISADPADVQKVIAKLEADQVILGYTAVVNEDRLPDAKVRALIEVKVKPQRDGGFDEVARRIARFPEVVRLYLVSGGYDLLLEVE
ncbi:MAG: Lrp/AsnC family transcriptional regulator, partial [Lentisphaeria bacterium]|nr:Lrp/AsnC family transcriptional regulator [Lentisphaeria bacterium]